MGGYVLAIDAGASRISAAVARTSTTGEPSTATIALGRATDTAPSTVFVGDHGMLFGDAAERRGLIQPERLLRAVTSRVGDETPFVAGERQLLAADVFAAIVGWVVEVARERESADPAAISVTVPIAWGDYRTGLVRSALDRAGLITAQLTTAAEAAAGEYENATPVRAGRALAVYDLGGGGFEAAVLRKERGAAGLRVAGTPVAADDVGGADIDDAILARVLQSVGLTAASPEFAGAPPLTAAALRRECIEAKEALSFDSETVVPVIVGTGGAIRLTRGELETMIEPLIERTMEGLTRAIDSARIGVSDLEAILLVGGSSRIPRVAQMLSERFDRPVVVEVDPKAIVAVGAARALAAIRLGASAPAELAAIGLGAAPPATERRRSWLRRSVPAAATGTAVLVLAAGIVVASGGSLATGTASLMLAGGQSLLSINALDAAARADDDVPETTPSAAPHGTPSPDAVEPKDDWSSPRASGPTRAPAAPRAAAPDTRRDPVPAPRPNSPSTSDPQSPAKPSEQANPPAPASDPTTEPPADPSAEPPTDPAPTPTDSPVDPAPVDPSPSPDPATTPDPEPSTPAPDPEPDPQPEPSPSTTQDTESPVESTP